ncbi:hypothetical protein [Aquimarina litoralis]|nr:hypothetical protein [Aquimarina litoralis]
MLDKILEIANVCVLEKKQQLSVKGGEDITGLLCIRNGGIDCPPHVH